ncbi:hypothetical protein [Chryseobacterium sp. GVT01B]|uniref:hypothetical protein n=1 Tax=Chryseobacterium sp. GVT01B TaxID=2862675 RepID=UPI001CBF6FE9|nr:hypothetical protein [Chryseobacterium sp. GVT01B]
MKKKLLFLGFTIISSYLFSQTGGVGIGTSSPDASAILDINSTNKGVLAPRISLTSITDATTIPSPATGLLVYNTGTAGLTFTGYVFWNGSQWRGLDNSSLTIGTIDNLLCNGATLSPSTYTQNVVYSGTLNIPYTGGNGGIYPSQVISSNGLTATLQSGNLALGAGNLIYSVSGTPTVSSPTTTNFTINAGGKTCTATVGTNIIGLGQEIYWSGTAPANVGSGGLSPTSTVAQNYLSYYSSDVPTIDGMRFDVYFIEGVTSNGTVSAVPRLVNVSGANLKVNFSAISSAGSYGTSNIWLADGQFINLDNGIYNGYGVNMTTSSTPVSLSDPSNNHTEIETAHLLVNGRWYKAEFYSVIDNNNTTNASDDIRRISIFVKRLK